MGEVGRGEGGSDVDCYVHVRSPQKLLKDSNNNKRKHSREKCLMMLKEIMVDNQFG